MNIKSLLFPSKCINCQKIENETKGGLCSACYSIIRPKVHMENNHIYLLEYKDEVKNIIRNGKFNDSPVNIKCLARLLGEKLKGMLEKDSLILYVPMHKSDIGKRGYNQSEIIANEIGKINNIKVIKNGLIKIKKTKHQSDLNREERLVNLENAFKLNTEKCKNKIVYIVDDIYTTGATLGQCANLLAIYKVKKIIFITLAKS